MQWEHQLPSPPKNRIKIQASARSIAQSPLMRGIVKIRSRNRTSRNALFSGGFTMFASSWSSLLPPVPGDTNDVLHRAITHSFMNNYGTGTASSRRFLFPGTTFRAISGSRYKIFDRVLREMSNEYEECFSDPLSTSASFFSRNHFFINVAYLFPHEFFSFINVSYIYIQGYSGIS